MSIFYWWISYFCCILAGLYTASAFDNKNAGFAVFFIALTIHVSAQCIVSTLEEFKKG
jgi:hypothetical protein